MALTPCPRPCGGGYSFSVRAIVVEETSANTLTWQTVADPEYGTEECLVDIHATAVNRADLLQRSGNYPPPAGASPYLGLEMAGVVAETGARVDQWHAGDRVCALLSGGGYAEQVAVPQSHLMRIPEDWDFEKAAAIRRSFSPPLSISFSKPSSSKVRPSSFTAAPAVSARRPSSLPGRRAVAFWQRPAHRRSSPSVAISGPNWQSTIKRPTFRGQLSTTARERMSSSISPERAISRATWDC